MLGCHQNRPREPAVKREGGVVIKDPCRSRFKSAANLEQLI